MEETKNCEHGCCQGNFLHFWWVKLLLGAALAVIVFGLGFACGQRGSRSNFYDRAGYGARGGLNDQTPSGGMMPVRKLDGSGRLNRDVQPAIGDQVESGTVDTSAAVTEPAPQLIAQ